MSAPYCTAEGCHDTRTNTYAVQTGPTTLSLHYGKSAPEPRTIFVNYPWGLRLCRIHALLSMRFAVGGAA